MGANQQEAATSHRNGVDWKVEYHPCLPSTQDLARTRDCWAVVIAREQTHGRGQYNRRFVSDLGGLFLSAVVPFDGDAKKWVGLSLVVGLELNRALRGCGVAGVRLRWPNDIMVGSKKLGGLLLEQAGPVTLVVGVGLNIQNQPWVQEPELARCATRLVDCGPEPGDVSQLTNLVLGAIHSAHSLIQQQGFSSLYHVVNLCWSKNYRTVELEMSDSRVRGEFEGVDERGALLLREANGRLCAYPASRVDRLWEVGAI